MSHLIFLSQSVSNSQRIGNQSSLAGKFRNTVKHKATRFVQNQTAKQQNQGQDYQQNQLIRTCRKLTYRQLNQFHRQSAKDLKIQSSKLKNMLRVSGKYKVDTKSGFKQYQVIKIFDENSQQEPSIIMKKYKASKFALNKINQLDKENLDQSQQQQQIPELNQAKDLRQIIQRNRQKIARKIQTLKEIKDIEKSKQQFKNWQNKSYNNPVKSPIYNRMIYLFEKIKKNNISIQASQQPSFELKRQRIGKKSSQQSSQQSSQISNQQSNQKNHINKMQKYITTQQKRPNHMRQSTKTLQNSPEKNTVDQNLSLNDFKSVNSLLQKKRQQQFLGTSFKYMKKIKKPFNLAGIEAYQSLM